MKTFSGDFQIFEQRTGQNITVRLRFSFSFPLKFAWQSKATDNSNIYVMGEKEPCSRELKTNMISSKWTS